MSGYRAAWAAKEAMVSNTARRTKPATRSQRANAICVLLVMCCALAFGASADASRATGPQRISGPSPLAQGCSILGREGESEAFLAVNPTNPRNLIATWSQGFNEANLTSATTDGGESWRTALPPKANHCSGQDQYDTALNPWVAFDAGGTAYLSTLLNDKTFAKANAVEVSRSTNGGASWDDAILLKEDGAGPMNDAPSVTGDAVLPGYAYVTWQRLDGGRRSAVLSRTRDSGRSWSTPKSIVTAPLGTLIEGNFVASLPRGWGGDTGDLLLAYGQSPAAQDAEDFYVSRSRDHGDSWGEPVKALSGLSGPTPTFRLVAGPAPLLYLVVQTPELAIEFVRSSDGGRTWSPPHTVVPAGTQASDWNVAVSKSGTLALLFYDHRNDIDSGPTDSERTTDVWMRSSRDGGSSWAETHVAGPFNQGASGFFEGLASLPDSVFGAAFILESPYADPSDVFFSRIRG